MGRRAACARAGVVAPHRFWYISVEKCSHCIHSSVSCEIVTHTINMAARFLVVLSVFAACQSTPILLNGALYRNERGYSVGQAYNYGGGATSASANVNGDSAQAYGSATGSQALEYYPNQVIAYEAAHPGYGPAKATAQAQTGGYYPVPAPATVITYEQNFEVPAEVSYEIPSAVNAQSSAISNGLTDTSISSATSNGAGVAQSSAQTQRGIGSYGVTSTNAKTYGSGYGVANSNANSGYGSASTLAQTRGTGAASSTAQSNGIVGAVYPVETTVIDAKTGYEATYVPSVPAFASSNANVNGNYGNAVSSAKASNGKSGISWRFGTAYTVPTPAALAQANANGYGAANANANVNGAGYVNSNVNTLNGGYGIAKSSANANGAGAVNSNAEVNGAGYGSANSAANTGYGNVLSSANTNYGYGSAKSSANSNGSYFGGSRTEADAQTNGIGSAKSSARTHGVSTAYRVSESSAVSSGLGSAHAKAHTA